jgi:hypothetical protein
MSKVMIGILGAAAGAGAMMLMDPVAGRRRRALIRDKANHYACKAGRAAEIVSKDLSNRAEGFMRGGLRFNRTPDLFQENWAPATRFLVAAAGLGLALYGMKAHGMRALLMELLASGMITEGITNAKLLDRNKLRHRAQKAASKVREAGQQMNKGGAQNADWTEQAAQSNIGSELGEERGDEGTETGPREVGTIPIMPETPPVQPL